MSPQQRLDLGGLRLDALFVSNLNNVRYLSGFTGSNGSLLVAPRGSTLFTDPRYTIQAGEQATSCRVKIAKGPVLPEAVAEIRRRKFKRVGFEQTSLNFSDYQVLRQGLPATTRLIPLGPLVEQLRAVKSAAEVETIRRSVIANSKAFDSALKRLKPAMTEADLACELEYWQRRHGAQKPAFDTIVATGAHAALPHAEPRNKPLGSNTLLLIDMGASLDGYASDMTRTLHLGKPAPKARKLYNAVLEAQLAATEAVRGGTTGGAVDQAARRVLVRHGMGNLFLHSTGHGLGLEIHELPRIGRHDETVLQPGMVITIEPGAYVEGYGGVRIEDTVLVTETGCEVLTPTPKDFIAI
jgi:Xaa-Pro aminopeptidase